MTAQINDTFSYCGQVYDLVGISEETDLFDPRKQNIEPIGTCTACWRGYACEYGLNESDFILLRLQINVKEDSVDGPSSAIPPLLGGIAPIDLGESGLFQYVYERICLKIDYTGKLLIASGFIRDLYEHMGYHPAWKFERVFELVFDSGNLTKETDVSKEIKEVRRKLTSAGRDLTSAAFERDILAWIERSFSRRYSDYFP